MIGREIVEKGGREIPDGFGCLSSHQKKKARVCFSIFCSFFLKNTPPPHLFF